MSALAMILTAAMVVRGDGPAKAPGEMAQQRLDLSGRWKGHCNISFRIRECEMTFKGWDVTDEGGGRAQFKLPVLSGGRFSGERLTCYGIYEQDGDHLKICISPPGEPHPSRFDGGDGRTMWNLHRIKPRK